MTAGSLEGLIEEGRGAFKRGDAEASLRAFEAALTDHTSAEVLEGHARALYLAGRYRESLAEHERSFAAYVDVGDLLAAARTARAIGWQHMEIHGDMVVAGGWVARAGSLLEEQGAHGSERGWIDVMRANQVPHHEREQRLRDAVELGRRERDRDLQFVALARLGETLVLTGRVEDGMRTFDEALTAVCTGEVSDIYAIESMFCGMFLTCERVHDVVRAERWLRAAGELVRRRNLVCVGPLCRAHYGGLLTAAGRWDEAEAEFEEAAREFQAGSAAASVIVLARLADLRVRQGRLEEAAALLEGLDMVVDAACPLAALQLARGELALAREVIQRRLAPPSMPVSWPIDLTSPLTPPAAAPLLALLADVCLADGALDEAARVVDELVALAGSHPSPYIAAAAAFAHGKLCVATRSGDARSCLRDALASFGAAQMPVEQARVRLELARLIAEEDPDVAVAEAKSALEVFERVQAAPDTDTAAALLRSLGASRKTGPRTRSPLTKRETEVLELLGHGLSNPEIAARLYISPKTAEHHVGHILFKLDLRNRSEAAVYAARAAASP